MFTTIQEIEEYFQQRKGFGIKPGLDRMYTMLEQLDHPEQELNAIHIAGTNGKGSTLSFLKQALMDQGYRVSSFVSPSFGSIREHIFLQNDPIDEGVMIHYMNQLLPIIDAMDGAEDGPTEFEILVVIAILYSKEYATISLFEAGMGGREDSTNVIHPILSIITSIDFDHTTFLGTTLKEITAHKAGIIKRDTPIVSGVTQQEARDVIQERATDREAPLYQFDKDFTIRFKERSYSFTYQDQSFQDIQVSLAGEHQRKNSSLALMGLLTIDGVNIEAAIDSFHRVQYYGRFETITHHPTTVIDGAHNITGTQAFIQAIQEQFPDRNKHLIYTALADKPIQTMIPMLDPIFDTITFTSFDHPRSCSPDTLLAHSSHVKARVQEDWRRAVDDLIATIDKEDVLFIAGSLYFIPSVKTYLINRQNL